MKDTQNIEPVEEEEEAEEDLSYMNDFLFSEEFSLDYPIQNFNVGQKKNVPLLEIIPEVNEVFEGFSDSSFEVDEQNLPDELKKKLGLEDSKSRKATMHCEDETINHNLRSSADEDLDDLLSSHMSRENRIKYLDMTTVDIGNDRRVWAKKKHDSICLFHPDNSKKRTWDNLLAILIVEP